MSTQTIASKRREMIALLGELSDGTIQKRLWIDSEDAPNVSGIDEVFHFLFDDTDLGKAPYSEVGRILENTVEADRIAALCKALVGMLNRLGDVPAHAFIADSEWSAVMKLAASALECTSKASIANSPKDSKSM